MISAIPHDKSPVRVINMINFYNTALFVGICEFH